MRFRDALATPTAIEMRKRLGGRVAGEPALITSEGPLPLGSVVVVDGARGAPREGVLLTVVEGSADIYVEAGLVKRVKAELVMPSRGASPPALAGISESAVVFGSLVEGQEVEIERADGTIVRGTLVEKCRYGSLVELEDGSLLGVGFKKIWPAHAPSAGPRGAN